MKKKALGKKITYQKFNNQKHHLIKKSLIIKEWFEKNELKKWWGEEIILLVVCDMWYGGINTVYKKSYARKIGNIHKALHYTKLSFIIFYGKMSQYSQHANCLQKN